MFDLRYHVASLAAVFVALVIGILVGVAMSGKVDDAEKRALKSDVNRLEAQLDAASEGRAKVSREHTALRAFIKNAYPMLIADRLHGKRVAVLFVGPVDAGVLQKIEQSISDAGGPAPMRLRALKVPLDPTKLDGHLDGDLAQYKTAGLDDLGREFADELVNGGDTPAWDALTSQLVAEEAGSFRRPADRRGRAHRQAAERRRLDVPLGRLHGAGRRQRPRGRRRALGRQPVGGPDLEQRRPVDRRRHRRPGRTARPRLASGRRLERELRAQGTC